MKASKHILVNSAVKAYLIHMKADLNLQSYNDVIKYLIDVEREKK